MEEGGEPPNADECLRRRPIVVGCSREIGRGEEGRRGGGMSLAVCV